jgi:hypothetical protein
MKKKFRFYVPIVKGRDLQALCVLVCIIVAMWLYFAGDVDRASFWMIAAMFNYLCYKL